MTTSTNFLEKKIHKLATEIEKLDEKIKNEGADPSLDLEDYERCQVCRELVPSSMISRGGVCAACEDVGGDSSIPGDPAPKILEELLHQRAKLQKKKTELEEELFELEKRRWE